MPRTITIDTEEMRAITSGLERVVADLGQVIPPMPGAAAFGMPIVAGAAAQFHQEMTLFAETLGRRYSALAEGVDETIADAAQVEQAIQDFIAGFAGVFNGGK